MTAPNNTVAAAEKTAKITSESVQQQLQTLWNDSIAWLGTHWLQILIAAGVAAVIVIVLHMLRRWGMKLCQGHVGPAGWGTILGRAVSKTGNFFIIMVAAR